MTKPRQAAGPAQSQLTFASALSDDPHPAHAVEAALDSVASRLGESDIDLAVLFTTRHHAHAFPAIADRLQRRLSPRASLGCTAAGVIGAGREVENKPAVSLLAARLGPGVWIHPITDLLLRQAVDQLREPVAPSLHSDDHALDAFRRALLPDSPHRDPAAIILLADPFSTPIMNLLQRLNLALPGVPVIGGLASAGSQPGENRLFINGAIQPQGAVALAIGGDIQVTSTVSQGCRPIGQPLVITQCRHNLIQKVGGRPILQVIQETADSADPADRALLSQYGLLVGRVINEYKDRFGRGDFLIRNILGVDHDAGYIGVSDLVKVGQTIQFHVRDRRTAEEDLRLLLEAQRLNGPACGGLIFTCNGRGRRLFNEPDAESHILRSALGEAPIAGFFAAGELGPIGRENFVHGFTASLALFRPLSPG